MPDRERISSELTGSHGGVSEEVLDTYHQITGDRDSPADIFRGGRDHIRRTMMEAEILSRRSRVRGASEEDEAKYREILDKLDRLPDVVRLIIEQFSEEDKFSPEELQFLRAGESVERARERYRETLPEEETPRVENFYERLWMEEPGYEGISEEVLEKYRELGEKADMHADMFARGTDYIRDLIAETETTERRLRLLGSDEESESRLAELRSELERVPELSRLILRDHRDEYITPDVEMPLLRAQEASQRVANRLSDSGEGDSAQNVYERLGIPGPNYEPDNLRTRVRIERSRRALGEQMPDEVREDFGQNIVEIDMNLRRLYQLAEEASKDESEEGRRVYRDLGREIASTSNLRAELMNVFEHSANKNASALNKTMSFITTAISTIGATQLISRFAISEPYRFETQPQLQVLGQQGQMGQVLGGAFGELEAYNYELNQMVFQTGAGMALAGGGIMAAARSPMAAAGGLALAGIGAAIGVQGIFGTGADLLRGIGFSTEEDQILGQALAKQFSDPSRMIQEYQTAFPGLIAAGGLEEDNIGFVRTGELVEGSTGNIILDRMLDYDRSFTQGIWDDDSDIERADTALGAFGYSREELGQLLTTTAMSLRGSGEELTDMAAFAGIMGGAYGIGEDRIVSMMQTAQRYGSTDAEESVRRAAGVFISGEDPESAEFAMNVLVPALMQVTESMAIRNLARSTEELETEVTSFANAVVGSDTRIGHLAERNPEIIARMMSGISASASMGVQDPAMAALDLSLGSSMADIILGRGSVVENRVGAILTQAGITEFGSTDEFLDRHGGIEVTRILQSLTEGMSPQDALALAELYLDRGYLFDEGGELDLTGLDEASRQRVQTVMESGPGQLTENLARQVNDFLTISSSLIDDLRALQETILEFIGDSGIHELIRDFFGETKRNIEAILDAVRGGNVSDNEVITESLPASQYEAALQAEGAFSGVESSSDALEEFFNVVLGEDSQNMVPSRLSLLNELYEGDQAANSEIFNFIQENTGDNEAIRGFIYERYPDMFENQVPRGEHGEMSVGGFTGIGGTHDKAGWVHAGEYVISANNVQQNREILDRIQSGERVSEANISQSQGNVTYLTMKIHGMSPEDIQNTARKVTEDYIVRNRLNYT